MTIAEMHYNFLQGFNKIASNQSRQFKIPEIDVLLNRAQELFVKRIAMPRRSNSMGFESDQRSIDDIRNIVVVDYQIPDGDSEEILGVENINDTGVIDYYMSPLPEDYWFFISGNAYITKDGCNCDKKKAKCRVVQHDDSIDSQFDKSSYNWGVVNIAFKNNNELMLFPGDDVIVEECTISYIKQLSYMHYAEGFNALGYIDASGQSRVGQADSELSNHTHSDIVDIAVFLATEYINRPDYKTKLNKLQINESL